MVDALNRLDQTDALVEQILGDRAKLELHANRGQALPKSQVQAYPIEVETAMSSELSHNCANFRLRCDTIDDSGGSTQRHDDGDKCAK